MKWVVVTGTSTGIGQATALLLARQGYAVFAGVRRQTDGEALRRAHTASAGRIEPLMLDVSDPKQINSAVASIHAAIGRDPLVALVNNAAAVRVGPTEALSFQNWQDQYATNLFGPAALTAALLPLLRASRGRVINVGSIGGRTSMPFMSAYTSSKFAMRGWTDSLRMELAPDGIRVVLIEPGAIATALWGKGLGGGRALQFEMPPPLQSRYGASIAALLDASAKTAAGAISPDAAAKVILHALTTRRPRTKYLVGTDAKIQALLAWLLPDNWLDAVLTRYLGLRTGPRNAPSTPAPGATA